MQETYLTLSNSSRFDCHNNRLTLWSDSSGPSTEAPCTAKCGLLDMFGLAIDRCVIDRVARIWSIKLRVGLNRGTRSLRRHRAHLELRVGCEKIEDVLQVDHVLLNGPIV